METGRRRVGERRIRRRSCTCVLIVERVCLAHRVSLQATKGVAALARAEHVEEDAVATLQRDAVLLLPCGASEVLPFIVHLPLDVRFAFDD